MKVFTENVLSCSEYGKTRMHAYHQLISLNLNTDSCRFQPGFKGVYLQNVFIVQINADRLVFHRN